MARTKVEEFARKIRAEALVDLDHVDREAPQVAERRVARTKVVDRDPDPQAFELAEAANRLLGLMGHHTFGDLQYQQLGRQPAVLERKADRGHQARVRQLDARQVDRDDKRRPDAAGTLPGACLLARFAKHPFAEGDDQAGRLRQRDEVVRLDEAALRMGPANERLHPGDRGSR